MSLLSDIWTKACEYIKEELSSKVSYRTWIETIVPYRMTEDEIYLSVPTEINKNMLEQRYIDLIINSVLEASGKKYSVTVTVGEEKEKDEEKSISEGSCASKKEKNSLYTFDNFVVGNSNRFAHALALGAAETPGKAYNPLFIWGGVGLGKTHLMHSMENYINENYPRLKTLFVSAETFTVELIESIAKKNTDVFREKYRKIDALFVDDIQFIAGKVSMEEEFFNTFNSLFEESKQIVLSSDRPPNEIPNLADRLKSRFGWGYLGDIQPPEYETRVAILKQKAENQKINIDTEILMYIADNITMNIRELEGVFKTLSAYSGLVNREITLDMAKDAIKKYRTSSSAKIITPEMIIKAVSSVFRIKEEDITSKRKTKEIVLPRQIAIYLCKNLTELSYNKIGEYFGGKDHSTIIHAIKKVEAFMEEDSEIKEKIEKITSDMKNS